MASGLKYNFQKEFQTFLHKEQIYNAFYHFLKNDSKWSKRLTTHFFEYVDARKYLCDLVRENKPNKEFWAYYEILWLVNLINSKNVEEHDKLLLFDEIEDSLYANSYSNPSFLITLDLINALRKVIKLASNISNNSSTAKRIEKMLSNYELKLNVE